MTHLFSSLQSAVAVTLQIAAESFDNWHAWAAWASHLCHWRQGCGPRPASTAQCDCASDVSFQQLMIRLSGGVEDCAWLAAGLAIWFFFLFGCFGCVRRSYAWMINDYIHPCILSSMHGFCCGSLQASTPMPGRGCGAVQRRVRLFCMPCHWAAIGFSLRRPAW